VDRIIGPIGRRVDESNPRVDARLPDGSRINVVIPPLALDGPTVTIRKFPETFLTMDDLIYTYGSLTEEVSEFLRTCVEGRLNVVIAGGTGSGKTTLLNALSAYIPDHERIVTIEDTAELQVHRYKPHVVRLESRPPNLEGRGAVTIRDLVVNSLRMRPDRIVVGECRAGETVDMLQAMNTGHDGSLTTVHANSPEETVYRMENMFLMSGMTVPVPAIRQQIAMAIQLVVQERRMPDGSRKVTSVTEIKGMDKDRVMLQELFRLEGGRLEDTGATLAHLRKLRMNLHALPPLAVFEREPETTAPLPLMAGGM
jgi:pilus assembly protein CpaF